MFQINRPRGVRVPALDLIVRPDGDAARPDLPSGVPALVPAGLAEELRVVRGQPLWFSEPIRMLFKFIAVHAAEPEVKEKPAYAGPLNPTLRELAVSPLRQRRTGSPLTRTLCSVGRKRRL